MLLCTTRLPGSPRRSDYRCFSCETQREHIPHEGSEAKVMRLRRERGITADRPNGHRKPNPRRTIDRLARPKPRVFF